MKRAPSSRRMDVSMASPRGLVGERLSSMTAKRARCYRSTSFPPVMDPPVAGPQETAQRRSTG
jgi:hypothetical protein